MFNEQSFLASENRTLRLKSKWHALDGSLTWVINQHAPLWLAQTYWNFQKDKRYFWTEKWTMKGDQSVDYQFGDVKLQFLNQWRVQH